jgi:NAD(P)-dependent dehydrogenase (short-subunit alcohol dehydrogenase family)
VSVIEPGAIRTEIWDKGRETADRLEKELPVEGIDRYGAHIAAVRKGIDMQARQGIGPEKVAVVVEHALNSPRPKSRYLVGKDARIQSAMVRLLSVRAREAIVRRVAGP